VDPTTDVGLLGDNAVWTPKFRNNILPRSSALRLEVLPTTPFPEY
jgi:hypothetical protein